MLVDIPATDILAAFFHRLHGLQAPPFPPRRLMPLEAQAEVSSGLNEKYAWRNGLNDLGSPPLCGRADDIFASMGSASVSYSINWAI